MYISRRIVETDEKMLLTILRTRHNITVLYSS